MHIVECQVINRRVIALNIYDVAKAAGVSTATVSRVMNGKPTSNLRRDARC